MQKDEFDIVVDTQVNRSMSVLVHKGQEYGPVDRLHNFKVAAILEKTTMRQALAGMMSKHTVSIYDMCESFKEFSIETWDEKITDHINYLLLLRAVVQEEAQDDESNPTLY